MTTTKTTYQNRKKQKNEELCEQETGPPDEKLVTISVNRRSGRRRSEAGGGDDLEPQSLLPKLVKSLQTFPEKQQDFHHHHIGLTSQLIRRHPNQKHLKYFKALYGNTVQVTVLFLFRS